MKNYFKIFWLSAFSLLFLTFAGYAQEGEADTEMTEEILIEIYANTMYMSEKFSEKTETEDLSDEEVMDLVTEMDEKTAALYEEHGVTEEAFDEFAEKYDEDDTEIMERIFERLEELRQQE